MTFVLRTSSSKMTILVIFVVICALLPCGYTQDTSTLIYRIYEETPSNSYIGDIPKDAGFLQLYDQDELSTITYSILTQNSEAAQYFNVDENSGILRTAALINREILCPQQVNCTSKVDIATQPAEYFQIVKITVHILDINDNSPEFLENPMTLSISENANVGTSYRVDTADDLDSPKFGIKRYELTQGGEMFELKDTHSSSSQQLHLVLRQPLDREIQAEYTAIITAYDHGVPPNSGSLTIKIVVLDVNDNEPTFEEEVYRVTVPEDTPTHTVIIKVKATDLDQGTNGQVVYAFDTKTEHMYKHLFVINNTTGEISLKDMLDYEEKVEYNLDVTAKDKNPDSNAVLTKVIVQVTDVNDHAPKITVNALTATGHVEILEGKPEETFVAHIAVEDQDSGPDGQFICNLEGEAFQVKQIFPTEYKVVTAAVLDRESTPQYDLIFVCWDQGESPKSSSVHIAVSILDENDNAPEFTQQTYSVTLEENNPVGGFLTQVRAVDLDAGANGEVEYRVLGSGTNFIYIDPQSGNITAKVYFDYEQGDRMDFTILAVDHGAPPQSSTAVILLKFTDVDDELPVFSSSQYSFDVYENQPMGTEVGEVAATDADSSPFNEFLFFLDPNAGHTETFVMEPQSGKIFTRTTLNRELKSDYQLVVMAIAENTPGMTSTSQVIVYVADKNDNDPVVYFPNLHNNTVYITNLTPIGTRVTHIIAGDADIGINGQLSFLISSGNEEDRFYIDQETGIIKIRSDLHQLEARVFQLTVIVHDNGYPRLSVEVTLNIVVNKSTEEQGISSQNLTIVISVVTISTILTIILVGAIVYVRRQDRNNKKRQHYSGKVLVGPGIVTSASKPSNISAIAPVTNGNTSGGYSHREANGDKQAPIYAVSQKKQNHSHPPTNKNNDMHSHVSTHSNPLMYMKISNNSILT